ncbi:Mediator of RNA polymerase II transcription subunit 6 [Geranomyces variabilis]|uniref:Mediator of RNA polymerase II transcription subunit 6 n=1 Tax=Geranomyces variabilis TaxID=109894 RepID=A0AAD5TEY3_9FUNG|nr:Mediator of RNA polymerase II transcription subunit 6 [Geranomyces variabilis]
MAAADDTDLTQVSWKDTAFIQQHGLNEHSIMPYFALSQFYDRSSLNEQIAMQARFNQLEAATLDKRQMTGIDYELAFASLAPPSLFIITKSMRRSPTHTDLLGAYYIIEGTIYQAPDCNALVSNRVLNSLHFVQKAFADLQNAARYQPAVGHFWESDEKAFAKATAALVADDNGLDDDDEMTPGDDIVVGVEGLTARSDAGSSVKAERRPLGGRPTRFLGDSADDRRRAGAFAASLDAAIGVTWSVAIEAPDACALQEGDAQSLAPTGDAA